MALFKILRGVKDDLGTGFISASEYNNGQGKDFKTKFNDGYCYFVTDTNEMYIDFFDKEGNCHREPISNTNYATIQMIDWEEKEMINFYIDDTIGSGERFTFTCEKGMTWAEFVDSEYNSSAPDSAESVESVCNGKRVGILLNTGIVVMWSSSAQMDNYVIYMGDENDGKSVDVTETIIPGYVYSAE